MFGAAFVFFLALLVSIALLFTMVFFVIMFSDLECDYINPIDMCNKLNPYVLPEIFVHGFMTLLFLLRFEWLALIFNLPLLAFNFYQISKQKHMFDATEIFRSLPNHKREVFVRLGFYLLSFFYYLYRLILALLE